ncbi:PAS domain S-box protein, partial [Candidatus Poribacteria bacterium]
IFAGVRKDDQDLLARIDAGLSAITNQEMVDMESRWIPDPNDRYFKARVGEVTFTEAEEAWLRGHETIRLGAAPNWAPFEYFDEDGTYMGMVSDYIRILSERTGVSMEVMPDLSWSEVIAKGKARELDVFTCVVRTPDRETYMNFTNPYLSFPCVIITRKQAPFVGGLRDLYGKKIAVERDYFVHESLRVDHPAIDLHIVDSTPMALKAVSMGAADAYVGNLATASYLIQNEGFANLKVAAPTSYDDYRLRIAVRKDWPELVGILSKSLASITPQQRDEIRQKWFSVRFEHGIDPADLWRLGLWIGGIAAVILVVVLLWSMHIRGLKERFRGLTEHGMDITQAFTESGKIVYQSPSHTAILGYEPRELLGKSAFDLFHEDDRTRWENVLNSLLNGQGVQFFEHQLRNKQGNYQCFESNCINLLDNKALKAIVINGRDVTERRQAEEARRENEEKLQTITASARDAIIMMDDIGRISYWNEAAVDIFGHTKEEAIGQEMHALLAPERYYEAYSEGVSKFQKTGDGDAVGKTLELVGLRKDGTEFPFELSLSTVRIKGKWNAVGILRDITEHKQVEMQLMQSEKMASLGMLVAGVAHEINTPVGAIISMHDSLVRAVERLKSILDTAVTEESGGRQGVDRMLEVIEHANEVITSGTERVANIVKRLRSFVHLDEAELKQVDIHEGIEDTLTMVQHELGPKAVIERNFGDIPQISCYPSQLNQVYLNLLMNAIQAIEDKGTITITTSQQDDHVHIQFKDTGIGIPEEALKRVFVPGYTTKERGTGTGLGLSICHQIVKDHNGDILVESEEGKGTTFTVVLPMTFTRKYTDEGNVGH